MGFPFEKCTLFPLNNEILSQCRSFSCGDMDLDDFSPTMLKTLIFNCWGNLKEIVLITGFWII
jgi:hypothetical protein